MPSASDTYGTVFERGSAVLLARVTHSDGQPVQQSDVSSISYTVSELDRCTGQATPVAGHTDAVLPVELSVYNTLQTDSSWSVDLTGYNFRHEIDVSTDEAFSQVGATYQVRYDLQPTSGQRVVFRFQLRAI